MVEVSLTVGKLDASLALLLTKEHHLIEFPTVLLPDGVAAGSVVTIKCEQNHQLEQQEAEQFEAVQDQILQLFGTHEPKTPNLRVKNVTQTSAVLEWDPLDLGSASIKSLTLYKDGQRLGQVPNPLANTTSKLSGLPVDTPYEFHLRLDTTAGVYVSEKVKVHTHKMTDLSGITVCLGDIDPSEGISREDIESALKNIGGRLLQTEVAVDTTHFVATVGLGAQWKKAVDSNIPVVRPEWLKACEQERRIVGVRNFYLDADPKFLAQHKFNKPVEPKEAEPVKEETPEAAEVPEAPKEETATKEEPATTETNEETPVTETPLEETPIVTEETVIDTPVTEEPIADTTSTPIEESTAIEEETTSEPIEVVEPIEETVEVEEPEVEKSTEVSLTEPIEEPTPAEEPVVAVQDVEETVEESEEKPAEDNFDDVDINATEDEPAAEVSATDATDAAETAPETTTEVVVEEEEEDEEEGEEQDITAPAESETKTQNNSNKKKNKSKKKKGKK